LFIESIRKISCEIFVLCTHTHNYKKMNSFEAITHKIASDNFVSGFNDLKRQMILKMKFIFFQQAKI